MVNEKTIVLLLADLTALAVDAMINPANESLLPGSGLCGVIHKKAGADLTAACQERHREQRIWPVGSAIATTAGRLPARYVIHSVGPKWHEHQVDPAKPLRKTYLNILLCAEQLELQTVSIPAISTGIHKYPKDFAARVVMEVLTEELKRCLFVRNVLLVSSNLETAMAYRQIKDAFESNVVCTLDLQPYPL